MIIFGKKGNLKKIYREYQQSLLLRYYFFEWAKQNLPIDSVVAVNLPYVKGRFILLQKGEVVTLESTFSDDIICVICAPNSFEEEKTGSVWTCFEKTSTFELWENTNKYNQLPLWHGLNEEEKVALVELVRTHASYFFCNGEIPLEEFDINKDLIRRLERPASVGVSVWKDGELRGCWIATSDSCLSATKEATVKALGDRRFKALTSEEFQMCRIEVSVMAGFPGPILASDMARDSLDSTKAYRAHKKESIGWFLPEVFNQTTFSSKNDFFVRLAHEKGGFSANGMSVLAYSVDGFIESENRSEILSLSGSVIRRDDLSWREIGEGAAAHLLSLIDLQGFMPSILNPFDIRDKGRISLPRAAFVVSALAEYQVNSNSDEERALIHRAYNYLHDICPRLLKTADDLYIASYLGIAAFYLKKEFDREALETAIISAQSLLEKKDISPILLLQVARLGFLSGIPNTTLLACRLSEKVLTDFKLKRIKDEPINLAEYADLFIVLNHMGEDFTGVREELVSWYSSLQNPDGSFPNSTRGGRPYVRGTGKIVESFASDPVLTSVLVNNSRVWLRNMQYTSENMYFIPPSRRDLFNGGFRHDALNAEVWSDATAHVLLAAVRLAQKN